MLCHKCNGQRQFLHAEDHTTRHEVGPEFLDASPEHGDSSSTESEVESAGSSADDGEDDGDEDDDE